MPETLILSLKNESQTYFENNINVFTNGVSLMALNSLETSGKAHALKAQSDIVVKTAKNMYAHDKYMKKKTGQMVKILRDTLLQM